MQEKPNNLNNFAQSFVRHGLLKREDALSFQHKSQLEQSSFIDYITEHKLVRQADIAKVLSTEFDLPLFDLSVLKLQSIPYNLVKDDLVRLHRALPILKKNNQLYIAISNPLNKGLNEIKFQTGSNIEPVLVEQSKLESMIDYYLQQSNSKTSGGGETAELNNVDFFSLGKDYLDKPRLQLEETDKDDIPVVKFVNNILSDAVQKKVSDIHIEPYENLFRIRFRVDGLLQEVAKYPLAFVNRVVSRLKIMSQIDISERRLPQDGRIRMQISKTRYCDLRLNTVPTIHGEKVVIRILNSAIGQIGIAQLGFSKEQEFFYLSALQRSQGMVLITGPTGSGKTVSLYAGLKILNTTEVNITTVEDPVEINLDGVNQININMKIGLDFSLTLRALLRQDPDVIMIGEIRDPATAEIAVKAAQTGHLILATLHTNNAAETLSRLHNLGIPAFNIVNSLSLIVSQRLARKLCPNCKVALPGKEIDSADREFFDGDTKSIEFFKPVGCSDCNNGYKGRIGVFEVVPINHRLSSLLMKSFDAHEISKQMRLEGFQDLKTSALQLVVKGLTSIAEVRRIT